MCLSCDLQAPAAHVDDHGGTLTVQNSCVAKTFIVAKIHLNQTSPRETGDDDAENYMVDAAPSLE